MDYILCITFTVLITVVLMNTLRGNHDADVYADGYQDGYLARSLKIEQNEKENSVEEPKPICFERNFTIGTLDKAKKVVNIAGRFTENIDVIRGHYSIDAKSIMGLLSLDISQPVTIKIHSEDTEVVELLFGYLESVLEE